MVEAPLPPPHPDPHAPSQLLVPPAACDTHCHIFGPEARFPYRADAPYRPAETPLERYRQMADRLGLERAVFVQPVVYGTDHAAMLDALARGNGRYAGVAILDDDVSDIGLERLHAAGVRGARLNFVGHLSARPSRDATMRVAHRISGLGWHLVFHVDAAALLTEADMIATLPCDFVIDHMARVTAAEGVGQPAFAQLLDLARDPRCWIKISAGDRMTQGDLAIAIPFMRAIAMASPDRTMWGTDWPHPNVHWMPDDGDLIDLLATAVPDESARNAILVTNPARLYDFH